MVNITAYMYPATDDTIDPRSPGYPDLPFRGILLSGLPDVRRMENPMSNSTVIHPTTPGDGNTDGGLDLLERPAGEVVPGKVSPPMYQVMLHNDDFTPYEFVIEILQRVFGKDRPAATDLMMTAHRKGMAMVGSYTMDVAQTKVDLARTEAARNGHPLLMTVQGE